MGESVGYAVRADAAMSKDKTQLSFVTPGLLLRRLGSDPTLAKYTHVIIDEVGCCCCCSWSKCLCK